MTKKKVPDQDKISAVIEYLNGKTSQDQIANQFNISKASVQQWIRNYVAMGSDVFITKQNKKYTKELKVQAVHDYLNGCGSQDYICKKYRIRSKSILQKWIKMYNSHDELKYSVTGGAIMTKGRKTTFDERVEIVEYCIAHDYNYAETSEKYQVSYQQARNYTVKYEANGIEALKDNRGKQKPADKMCELEKLRVENRILRAKKKQAEIEISFLKKLEDIERRRG
jgi:transposase-like protein